MIVASFVVAAVSSCDRKAEGQTVAVVNGEEITSAELNAELSRLNIPASADKTKIRSQVLKAIVDRRLLAQQAKSDGIDKSPEFLSRQRRANEDLLLNMYAQRQASTSKLPTPQEIAAFQNSRPELFAQRAVWDLDQLTYATPKDAAALKDLPGTHSLDAVAAVLTKAGIAFNRQKNRINTGVMPHDLFTHLAALPPGEPFIVPAGDRSIASVIVGREPQAPNPDEARALAVQGMRQADSQKFMETRLNSLRSSAKIEYQPGFGPVKP